MQLLTPDGPHRFQSEAHRLFCEAHVRIYQLAMECCADVRAMIESAESDEVEDAIEYMERVDTPVKRQTGYAPLLLGVDIHVQKGHVAPKKSANCTIVKHVDVIAELDPRKVCEIFTKMKEEPKLLEGFAELYIPAARELMTEALDEYGRYDEIALVSELFQRLRENIIDGKLPMPAKPLVPSHRQMRSFGGGL